MKTSVTLLTTVLAAVWLLTGCDKHPGAAATSRSPAPSSSTTPSNSWSLEGSGASTKLKQFLATQETQARALAKTDGVQLPPQFDAFSHAAETSDWQAATNLYQQMLENVRDTNNPHGSSWSATLDADGVFELFPPGDKYAIAFGQDIIRSIPAGSIYFGGTDAGRFVVTALMESHADGKPFFMLSQNPLTDLTYLHYLQSMYGGKIHTLTDQDSQKCFHDYSTDTKRRQAHDQQFPKEPKQLKLDEEIHLDANGEVQLSSHMNVIGVRELLTKMLFDKNPDREFYVEESYPLDWMYWYLEPHGLILKLDRQSLPELSAEIIQRDRDYWIKYLTPLLGDWLKPETTVADVAVFVEKIQVKRDLSEFVGEPQFVQNEMWTKNFSKLRSSIAGLYAWRAQHATGLEEKRRLTDAADFAFRQAWALCPSSLEATFGYVNLLTSQNCTDDALLIANTTAHLPQMQPPNGGSIRVLITSLTQPQKVK